MSVCTFIVSYTQNSSKKAVTIDKTDLQILS